MNILIIGGTRFLGRHLVEIARAHGHELTLFNRGKTGLGLFPGVETILGDRTKDLNKLSVQSWDAVIDTSGYFPQHVRASAQALAGAVKQYVFISSISVYPEFSKVGINEEDPLTPWNGENVEENNMETYGLRKVLCEEAVRDVFGAKRTLIVRPGLIVGPHDPTDRFTYWPVRVARGGDVLAPDRPDAPIQVIDVRDLSEFTLKLVEEGASGVYNATGPDYELTIGELLETSKRVSESDASFNWAPLDFLEQNHIAPWSDLPAWVPDTEESAGFSKIDVSKAINVGLTFRPLEETVRDTLAWASTRPAEHEWQAGLKEEREKELLRLLNKA